MGGKMSVEASKEVPPLAKDTKPLPDPHAAVPETDGSSTRLIQPSFPLGLDAIDDHISSHLPLSLTRHSLGFPLAALITCLFMVLLISFITYRLRRHIRVCLRRLARFSSKRDRDLAELSLEQGGSSFDDPKSSSPRSSPPRILSSPSRWWRFLRPFTSMWRYSRHRPLQYTGQSHRSLSRQASIRPSPIRQSASTSSAYSQQIDASTTTSRSSSPILGAYDEHVFFKNIDAGEASSISLYSRSDRKSVV